MASDLKNKLNEILLEKANKLIPSNIRDGVEIFGVTGEHIGTDTTDGTATSADIANGKIAYVNGERIEGKVLTVSSEVTLLSDNIGVAYDVNNNQLTSSVDVMNDMLIREDAQARITVSGANTATAIGLTADQIVKGSTILGIAGTNEGTITADANATAADMLEGTSAYVQGAKVEGTISNNGELTYTPGDDAITIPEGYTTGGVVEAVNIENLEEYQDCLEASQAIVERIEGVS